MGGSRTETVTRIVVAGRARIVVAAEKAELSSLLASSVVLASQTCLQSQGSGGSWSRNSELVSLLVSSVVFASQKGSTVFCNLLLLVLWICLRGHS